MRDRPTRGRQRGPPRSRECTCRRPRWQEDRHHPRSCVRGSGYGRRHPHPRTIRARGPRGHVTATPEDARARQYTTASSRPRSGIAPAWWPTRCSATGGLAYGLHQVPPRCGAKDIRCLTLVSAPEGVRCRTRLRTPTCGLYTCALDRELNAKRLHPAWSRRCRDRDLRARSRSRPKNLPMMAPAPIRQGQVACSYWCASFGYAFPLASRSASERQGIPKVSGGLGHACQPRSVRAMCGGRRGKLGAGRPQADGEGGDGRAAR